MIAPADRSPSRVKRNLYATYAAGLFSQGQSELLTLVVPLWAMAQGVSPTEIGALVSARSLLTFFLAIHGGAMMDRLGTRRVMLAFAVITGALAAAYPFATWFPTLLALQVVIGFAANMAWLGAQTLIAQVTRGDPALIGRFSFFSKVGNFIVPVLMGALWDIGGPKPAFFFISTWCAVLFASVWLVDRGGASATAAPVRWTDVLPRLSDYTGSLALLLVPAVALATAISFIRHAAHGVEASFFIVYLKQLGFAGTAIGLLFGLSEVVNGFGSLGAGRIARAAPIAWGMVGLTALGSAMIVVTPFLGGVFLLLLAAQAGRRACEGLVQPLMFSIQARAVDPRLQGSVVGLRITANRLASIVVPFGMGFTVDVFGLAGSFVIVGGLMLLTCGGLAVAIMRTPGLQARDISRSAAPSRTPADESPSPSSA